MLALSVISVLRSLIQKRMSEEPFPEFVLPSIDMISGGISDLICQLNYGKEQAEHQREVIRKMLLCKSIYLEAAYIADDVYKPNGGALFGGWKRSKDYADLSYCNPDSALVSGLYERVSNGRKEYIYATAGTQLLNEKDWENNIAQVIGDSIQYQEALEVARSLSSRIKAQGGTLMFVGHSLGGGEATNNALATHHSAIVFNPAGLSLETMKKSGIDPLMAETEADSLVVNFVTDNDILNQIQDCAKNIESGSRLIPSSIGKRYYLKGQSPIDNLFGESKVSIVGHLMDGIITGMESLVGIRKS